LVHEKLGKVSSFQLFGNNDWFEVFEGYLKNLGVEGTEDDDFTMDGIEVPSLKDLITAIDETVWYEIIEPSGFKERVSEYGVKSYESDVLDVSSYLLSSDKEEKLYVKTSLYGFAREVLFSNYLFVSYSMVEWLKSLGALENFKLTELKGSYLKDDDLVALGDLKPDYSLTLSYF
jgi:hypothetical protein